jgi:hypothetical protein
MASRKYPLDSGCFWWMKNQPISVRDLIRAARRFRKRASEDAVTPAVSRRPDAGNLPRPSESCERARGDCGL